MALPSGGPTSNVSDAHATETGNSRPPAAHRGVVVAPSFLYFRLALALFAIVAGTEGYLTLQTAKTSLQTTAGLLAFLTAAILIGTAIVFEPLRALFRRAD